MSLTLKSSMSLLYKASFFVFTQMSQINLFGSQIFDLSRHILNIFFLDMESSWMLERGVTSNCHTTRNNLKMNIWNQTNILSSITIKLSWCFICFMIYLLFIFLLCFLLHPNMLIVSVVIGLQWPFKWISLVPVSACERVTPRPITGSTSLTPSTPGLCHFFNVSLIMLMSLSMQMAPALSSQTVASHSYLKTF